MGAVKQWQIEKLNYAERLYTALTAVVGEVEELCLTGASLHWCAPNGVEGFWREEQGDFWLGLVVPGPDGEGTLSTQLRLALECLGEEDEGCWLAHPTVYRGRTGDGHITDQALDTPQMYAAAQTLLTELSAALRAMVPPLPTGG